MYFLDFLGERNSPNKYAMLTLIRATLIEWAVGVRIPNCQFKEWTLSINHELDIGIIF